MTKPGTVRSALGVRLALMLALPLVAHAQVASPLMVGRWKGEAEIVVNWTQQRTLPVTVVIFANDMVTGTVGDADLVNGQLSRNRGWFASVMRWKTDYIIDANLKGPIIRAEHIERSAVRIPLNFIDTRFEGGINTSGTPAGGADTMILAARRLVLHRVPDVTICTAPSNWYAP